MEKISGSKAKYRGVAGISKLASPILNVLFYVLLVCVLLTAIVAFIMIFVGTSVDDIMLPPYMSRTNEGFFVTIGNGIKVFSPAEYVELGDIKTVIYAELLMLGATLCILAPLSRFLSRLTKNLGKGDVHNPMNARYMMYAGLTVAVGYTFVGMASDFYNWLLVNTFVAGSAQSFHLSMSPDFGGILVGVLIILFAYVYGNACAKAPQTSETKANGKTDSKDVTPV